MDDINVASSRYWLEGSRATPKLLRTEIVYGKVDADGPGARIRIGHLGRCVKLCVIQHRHISFRIPIPLATSRI